LSFLEGDAAHGKRALSPFEARQAAGANPKITPEELFVIEKFTGFNRFRRKYRRPQAMAEFVGDLSEVPRTSFLPRVRGRIKEGVIPLGE
jgi:hypothetical protein